MPCSPLPASAWPRTPKCVPHPKIIFLLSPVLNMRPLPGALTFPFEGATRVTFDVALGSNDAAVLPSRNTGGHDRSIRSSLPIPSGGGQRQR
jgi:hypothetical protein